MEWKQFAKELATTLLLISVVAVGLYSYAGTWPPLVSVDGQSMFPTMHDGDLVLIQKAPVYGVGDIIVYRPFGQADVTPVIHRVLSRVDANEPLWSGAAAAPDSGYITKGDNNYLFDQAQGVCPNTPVKDEWVLGKTTLSIPLLGHISKLLFFLR